MLAPVHSHSAFGSLPKAGKPIRCSWVAAGNKSSGTGANCGWPVPPASSAQRFQNQPRQIHGKLPNSKAPALPPSQNGADCINPRVCWRALPWCCSPYGARAGACCVVDGCNPTYAAPTMQPHLCAGSWDQEIQRGSAWRL